MPDQMKPFQIESDTSKFASGAILTQLNENGLRHPCTFYSQLFSPTKRNYQVYEQELLGIIRALKEWRHYIQGAPYDTMVFSDHQNLQYWKAPQDLNRRQARWHLYLSEFDLKLVHMPGTKMIQSNALSQHPDHCPEEDNDNEQITMLPAQVFINLIDVDLQKKITNSPNFDYDATSAIKLLLNSDLPHVKESLCDWTFEMVKDKPLLFYQGKNYIPKDIEI
ncbi:unnamed protein product [Cyclocybe aegerita]|uniref:Reverse transcriptase RNase H-like domain-containing protein n=1 Tax=Cyclocybe aegerita TaxID=1973307 RepID=A0A8S0VQK8_CYCAE|nr:unnamed protein product [Cyclocybe aegerita]